MISLVFCKYESNQVFKSFDLSNIALNSSCKYVSEHIRLDKFNKMSENFRSIFVLRSPEKKAENRLAPFVPKSTFWDRDDGEDCHTNWFKILIDRKADFLPFAY